MAVGGRDDYRSGIEQRPEQPLQDHRVGDVVDLELVEAQERSFLGESRGDVQDRLTRPGAALAFDAVMDIEHEGVKMHPPLARDWRRREKQIHQHRLAPPDRPPEIETFRYRDITADKPGEPASPGWHVICQGAVQRFEPLDRMRLGRIGPNRAGGAARPVKRTRPGSTVRF